MKKEYKMLLEKALAEFDAFSLVWREDMEFDDSAKQFEEKLKPFLVKEERTNCWPGTQVLYKSSIVRTYQVSQDSIHVLKCVDSVFEYVFPHYPEDLAFYQDGMLVYASIAHEKYNWYE